MTEQDRHMRNANNAAVAAVLTVACGGGLGGPQAGYIINLGPCGTLPGHNVAHGAWWHLALGYVATWLTFSIIIQCESRLARKTRANC